MNIKNYTSQTPVANSLQRIENLLAVAGAINVSKFYDNGVPVGIMFQIMQNNVPYVFKLPTRLDPIEKILKSKVKRPGKNTYENIRQQAARTSWKLLSEWVEIQLSFIQMEQAEVLEVFLPYTYNPRSDKTLFETYKGNGFKQLTEGKQ